MKNAHKDISFCMYNPVGWFNLSQCLFWLHVDACYLKHMHWGHSQGCLHSWQPLSVIQQAFIGSKSLYSSTYFDYNATLEKLYRWTSAVKSGAHMHYADAPDICISTKCTWPTLNRSSAIQHLECGNAFELCIIYVKPSQLMLWNKIANSSKPAVTGHQNQGSWLESPIF